MSVEKLHIQLSDHADHIKNIWYSRKDHVCTCMFGLAHVRAHTHTCGMHNSHARHIDQFDFELLTFAEWIFISDGKNSSEFGTRPTEQFQSPLQQTSNRQTQLPSESRLKDEDRVRLTENHSMMRIPPTKSKRYPSKRCKVCLSRFGYGPTIKHKYPKETTFYCSSCPSKPSLCSSPCFGIYHSKLRYWEADTSDS